MLLMDGFLIMDNKTIQLICRYIRYILVFVCVLFFVYYTIRWSWCSDDAYHAYSMSKNLINGCGFTPTIGKRVNVSTCPLWTLVVTLGMYIFHDEYYVGLVLNLLFSWGAFAIILMVIWGKLYLPSNCDYKFLKTIYTVLLTILLCSSKAFISYTSSGLENSMLFFLSSVLLLFYFRIKEKREYFNNKDIFLLAFIWNLIIFTRLDSGLVFLPLCSFAGLKVNSCKISDRIKIYLKRIFIAILGIIPFIGWEIFSLFYYGMLVPNTALSKLNEMDPIV